MKQIYNINQKYISQHVAYMPHVAIAIIYLISSFPGIEFIYLALSLGGFVYWSLRKKDEYILILLLLGSSFSYNGLSMWNNGIIPALPLILIMMSLFFENFKIKTKNLLISLIIIGCIFMLSAGNLLDVGASPFIIDLLILLSIPLAAIRFRKLTEIQFFNGFLFCALISLVKIVVFAYVGIENPVLSTNNGEKFLDTHDELMGAYLLFMVALIFSSNRLQLIGIVFLFCWFYISLFSIHGLDTTE